MLHFPSQNPSNSHQKPILKGIDFLINFDIDLKTAQEGPKTAQDGDPSAKTAPRGPQDGPKMAPRASKKLCSFCLFSVWPPRAPKGPPETPPRLIFGSFLVDFWSIFDVFCIDFWSIFDSFFDLGRQELPRASEDLSKSLQGHPETPPRLIFG